MAFCRYCGKQLEEGERCICPESLAQTENPAAENRDINEEGNLKEMYSQYQQDMEIQYQQEMNPQYQQGVNIEYQQGANFQYQQGINPAYNQNNVQFDQMKEKSGVFLREMFGGWISIVKSPAAAGCGFVQSNHYQAGIGLIVIQAVLTGIFGVSICSTINKLMKLGSYLSSDSNIAINLVLAFVLTVIGSIALSAARTGLLLGGAKIFKGIADWKRVACVCGVRAVGVNLVQVVSIVVYFMNPFWGICFFAFSWIAGLIFMMPVVLGCMEASEDKGIYTMIIVTVLCLVVLGILYKIGMPMYVPSELKDNMNEVFNLLKGY